MVPMKQIMKAARKRRPREGLMFQRFKKRGPPRRNQKAHGLGERTPKAATLR